MILPAPWVQLLPRVCGRSPSASAPVELFDPVSSATWLITEMIAQKQDILFGLYDLGFGHSELGSVRLSELEEVRDFFGIGIQQDANFKSTYPLPVYTIAAMRAGAITEDEALLKKVNDLRIEGRKGR